jgi:PAS domain S-box-containing protein
MISVLYVDDEPDLLEIGKTYLEHTGDFRVDTMQSPLEVLSHLAKNPYDAIVCDYQMSEMDGISLLKQVRKDNNDIPFILFTGRGREEVVIEALNHGADFYLQKGGAAQAQFAELASKLRQAVTRRQAERSLQESEKKLHDIINFLPDAIFAIDRKGVVITWNRAIEEMTGFSASDMIGKGDFEYAIPIYGMRRPILIDLIFEPDETLKKKSYGGIIREKDVLIAESNLPRPMGVMKVLMGKASPLYNQAGEIIGAIESIRDITSQKQVYNDLWAAHEQLTASEEELRSQYEELVQAETQIRLKEEQLREIAANLPGVVFQLFARPGGKFGFYYVSECARDVLGIDNSKAEFFERLTAQIHPEDRDTFLDSLTKAVRRSDRWLFEGRFFKPSGEMIWISGMSNLTVRGSETVFSGVVFDISERKSTEETFKDETEKYRILIENSQDAVFIIQDKKLVFANRALSQITGYGEAEIKGMPIEELIAPEDRDMVMTRYRDRLNERTGPECYEFSLLHADGKTRIRVRITAGLDSYRGLPATIGTFHDVTSERQRKEVLEKSEQKYRELAELLPQIVFEVDTDMQITYSNNFSFETFGRTREDMVRGINALDYLDPSQHEILKENIRKIIQGEPHESPEYILIRKDGSRFPGLIYSSPIFQDQKLTGFRGVIIDISAWKTATAAQTESEDRYRSLAEAAHDFIYIIDKNDNVAYVNDYCLQMLGKSSEEIMGKSRSALFPEPIAAKQYQSIQRVFTTGQPLRMESKIPLHGRETWQDTHLVPLKNTDGTITAVMGISRDISQIKQADTALKRSNEKLNLLNSITRHDVANQLTVLKGYIQLAIMQEPDTMIGDFLKKIEAASDKIQRQIEFTKAYQDLGIRAPDWFNLFRIIEKVRPEGIVLTNLCRDIEVFADPMLEKVFFNLFDNAIRHGERVTSMIVRCESHEDNLVIIVEDDGIGIPLDEKQKVFQKGFGKNTGFGLFLVREILAITDIDIHETGRHGSGARFEITVPKNGFRTISPE